ncbi:MAG: pyridoxal phosphate-dependent aminotransferase [Pseudomonadales bacterium]
MSEHERLIASAVAEARVSAIKDMALRSAAVPDVASLAWGLPSFRTPKHIRRAAARALAEDPDAGKYTLPDGLPELRRLAAAHYQARTGIALDSEANLFVSAGNMQGVNSVLRAILDPGDEVIVTDPGFASHYQQVRLNGGTPVPWSLDEEAGWALNLDALDACLSPRSKALILVSPSNPTGAVFSEADLRAWRSGSRSTAYCWSSTIPIRTFCPIRKNRSSTRRRKRNCVNSWSICSRFPCSRFPIFMP